MSQTYGSYLQVEELLSLQKPLSSGPEHDEMLFIVIHQVYELWFKQILHELDRFGLCLAKDDAAAAAHTVNRVLKILKVMVSQIDVIETMTPLEFLSFRARLESASGFQSAQFREFEALLGFRSPKALTVFPEGSPERARIEQRFSAPSLWDVFLQYLGRRGFGVSGDEEQNDAELVRMYREDTQAAAMAERLVDIDEAVQEWRYRHVKMVQRTIGMKQGTGGSPGVSYLWSTLDKVAFPALWRIRAQF